MRSSYFFLLVLTCWSCANNTEENTSESEAVAVSDTGVIEKDTLNLVEEIPVIPLDPLLISNFKELELPYALDSGSIENLNTEKRISAQQVDLLTQNITGALAWEMEYELNTFYKIDSLKQINKYEDYVSSLDIGQMKNSEAFALGFLDLGNNKQLFLWGLQYTTYEACPFMHGTTVYGSLFENGVQKSVRVFAEAMAGGDPPSMMSRVIELQINENGEAQIHQVEIQTELAEEGEDDVELKEKTETIQL